MTENQAAIYVRVSSEEQRDGHSLSEQLFQCREFCKRRGYKVEVEYEEVQSAKNVTTRAKFQEMLGAAQAKRFDVIVCHKLDRFSRDVTDGLLTLQDLARYGVKFVAAAEDFDFTTPMGEVMLTMMLAFARMYRRNLIGETTKGKQGRHRAGLSNASKPVFGYQRVMDDSSKRGTDVRDANAGTAIEMFQRFETGDYSDMQIADWLNSEGKTTTGAWGSRAFSKDTVRAMLINPFYCGDVTYRGLEDRENENRERMRRSKRSVIRIPGKHEALISRELFERCQEVRAARGRKYAGRKASVGRVYLLSRIGYCAHCGGPLRATRWGAKSDSAGYRCTAKERAQPCDAQRQHVPQIALLDDMTRIMAQMQMPDDVKSQAIALITADDPSAAIERQRSKLDAELQRVNRMYQSGNVNEDYYDAEARRIRTELARLTLPTDKTNIKEAIAAMDDMVRLWQGATLEEQAEIMSGIFERIDVDLDLRRIVGFLPKKEYAALCKAAFANYGSDGIRNIAKP